MQQMEVSDYVNESPRPKQKGSGDANQTERRLCQMVVFSFGLLCVIQAILNVSLRLTFSDVEAGFKNLTEERDDLKRKLNKSVSERDTLKRTNLNVEARFKTLTEESDDLNRKLNNVGGWEYFSGSFYYISSVKKTWNESRDDCLQKGADLVIINSKEEQNFTIKFEKRLWIGLTDSETEGTWKWVDGTPLTKSYWVSGEPNDEYGEDCGEISHFHSENSWNDVSCSFPLNWICEMKVRP
ncbi:CD209 antigen-like protein C isoform X2 [Perca fluviatilis]|uniref:CD209 antigen-like protein C isoform X2 n=1 Tax=Perca fluviatilis TaxID=8168 RepID=UPI001965D89B|nr:CD209 antigen-like protein C isoform X2 [Perca fluviatilis]